MTYIKIILIVLFLIIPVNIYATKWTSTDTKYEIAYTVLDTVDWLQTRYISTHSIKFHEVNPILGKHPSIGKVNMVMGASLIGHWLISYILPKHYRRIWQREIGRASCRERV